MVVVPTAQAGRRLRRRLAEVCGAVVPPHVVMPSTVVMPADREKLANRTDELLAFWEALGAKASLDEAAQIVDVRRALGANVLTCADVAARVGNLVSPEIADSETVRWQQLAEIEARAYAVLARRGKTDTTVAMKATLAAPTIKSGITEIVLACVLEPLPALHQALEGLNLPVTELLPEPATSPYLPLTRAQIQPSGTATGEATKVAAILASVAPQEALPAVCLADATMFPELQGALQAKGIRAHNPSATPLATSALGHLIAQLCAFAQTSSYAVFSALIRGGDVRRWLEEALGFSVEDFLAALVQLDELQAQYLPERVADIYSHTTGTLRKIFDFILETFKTGDLRTVLTDIFRSRQLNESESEAREFMAAAQVVQELLTDCFNPSVPEERQIPLFQHRLKEVTYSLEPDEGELVQTDGWLELPFVEADELRIVGFQEGCVPESIVGHAFLPDSLRAALGLPSNQSRTIRDTEILRLALACRRPEAVSISFHAVDSTGDVLKPSRLLFLCEEVSELAARVSQYYGIQVGTEEGHSADLPEAWKLNLPIPPDYVPLEKTSPTKLDAYLNCPLTYYLTQVFGESTTDVARELDAAEFGTLAHRALELWALSDKKDSEDASEIAQALAHHVDSVLMERFGSAIPAIVALQGESVKTRLKHFASQQVAWHKEGWRIVGTEEWLSIRYGHTCINGKVDRIDRNCLTGAWCVIDYKTWDSDKSKNQRLQLPLYVAMLDASEKAPYRNAKRAEISSCYCVLAKAAEDVIFTPRMDGECVPDAEVHVRELIARIERGIFWPPNRDSAWKYQFDAMMFQASPSDSLASAWIADQERRLAHGL